MRFINRTSLINEYCIKLLITLAVTDRCDFTILNVKIFVFLKFFFLNEYFLDEDRWKLSIKCPHYRLQSSSLLMPDQVDTEYRKHGVPLYFRLVVVIFVSVTPGCLSKFKKLNDFS